MKAIVCHNYGLEHAVLTEVDEPDLQKDEIKIQVHAIGVSFANLLVIHGQHQNKHLPPFTPGTEVAGTVIAVGENTRLFKKGDRVVAGLKAGGYAEKVCVAETTVFHLPDQVSFTAAVQFPTIYATAYGALKWRAQAKAGETLLVHGAAGGSGLAAIEIGKQLGCRVIATAGNDEKLTITKQHGADITINYHRSAFRDIVLEQTDGRGADIIFDPVGGDVLTQSLRCIAPEGRLIPMGFASGVIPQIPTNIVLVKNITIIGIYWGYYMGWARQAPSQDTLIKVRSAFTEMLQWTAEKKLQPRTWKTFGLADFKTALHALSSREVIGRIVLTPDIS